MNAVDAVIACIALGPLLIAALVGAARARRRAVLEEGARRQRLRTAEMLRARATMYREDNLPWERHMVAELWCIADELDPLPPDVL